MEFWISALQTLLPFCYAALVYVFAQIFFRSGEAENKIRRVLPFVYLVVALHGSYIGFYTVHHGRCLLGNFPEIASLIAFTLLVIFAFAEVRVRNEASGTGFFVCLIAALFQIFSSIAVTGETELASWSILKDPTFNVHVTAAIFGYSAWTLATVYGALYLLLYRAMRTNSYGAVFEHLPNLERLEKFGLRATAAGFFFLSVSIVAGWFLMTSGSTAITFGDFVLHPKILATLLAWAVFGATLFARKIAQLEGKRLVVLWMSGFVFAIISMGFINAFGTKV